MRNINFYLFGILCVLVFSLFVSSEVYPIPLDKECSGFVETADGFWYCPDNGKVYECEGSPNSKGLNKECKNAKDLGVLTKSNFMAKEETNLNENIFFTRYKIKTMNKISIDDFNVDWGEQIGRLVNKKIIRIYKKEIMGCDLYKKGGRDSWLLPEDWEEVCNVTKGTETVEEEVSASDVNEILSSLNPSDEFKYRIEAEFDPHTCEVIEEYGFYKIVHCVADPVVSFGGLSYPEWDVWEQYKSVWIGSFTDTAEDGNGNITLNAGTSSGSFVSNNYDNGIDCSYGCQWDALDWSGDDVSKLIQVDYEVWSLNDTFPGSSLDGSWTFSTYLPVDCQDLETCKQGSASVEDGKVRISGYGGTPPERKYGRIANNASFKQIGMYVSDIPLIHPDDATVYIGYDANLYGGGALGNEEFAPDCAIDNSANPGMEGSSVYFRWLDSTTVDINFSNGTLVKQCTGLSGSVYYPVIQAHGQAASPGTIDVADLYELTGSGTADSYVGIDVCFSDDNITFSSCQYNVTSGTDLGNDTAKYVNWSANFIRTLPSGSTPSSMTSAKIASVNLTYIPNPVFYETGSYPVSPAGNVDVYVWVNMSYSPAVTSCNFTVVAPASGDYFLFNENASSNDGYVWNSTIFKSNETGVFNWNVSCTSDIGRMSNESGVFGSNDGQEPDLVLDNPVGGTTYSSSPSLNFYVKDDYYLNEIKYTTDNWASSTSITSFSKTSDAQYVNHSLTLADGSYTLILNVSDLSGNINSSNVSFTVSSPSPPSGESPGGTGGGPGVSEKRGWEMYVSIPGDKKGSLLPRAGTERLFSFKLRNKGVSYAKVLLECVSDGVVCDWVSLDADEVFLPATAEFVAVVNGVVHIPEGVASGDKFFFSIVGKDKANPSNKLLQDKVDFSITITRFSGYFGELIDKLSKTWTISVKGVFGDQAENFEPPIWAVLAFFMLCSIAAELIVLTLLKLFLFKKVHPRNIIFMPALVSVIPLLAFWWIIIQPVTLTL